MNRAFGRFLRAMEQLAADAKPRTPINQAGYHLYDLVDEGKVDLTRLLTGCEGTLGVITEVTLRTINVPRHRGVVLLFFHRMDSAATAGVDISKLDVVACDMLDRRLLRLACENDASFRATIPNEAEAMLLVELEAPDDSSLRDRMEALVQRVVRRKKWAFDYRTTTQKKQRDAYWKIARRAVTDVVSNAREPTRDSVR